MEGVFSRLGWFAVAAVAIAYVSYLIAGGIVNVHASGRNTVVIRDELHVGAHQLSGMVMVPTPCDELTISTQSLSPTTYSLIFKTWREPSVRCPSEPTPRAFRTILFAPAANVYFVATLDGVGFPVAVVPVTPNSTP